MSPGDARCDYPRAPTALSQIAHNSYHPWLYTHADVLASPPRAAAPPLLWPLQGPTAPRCGCP